MNSLPNDKIVDWLKLKAFADDKINVTEKLKFVLGREENNLGKGENAGYQHFLLFPKCFQKASFSRSVKSGLCGKESKRIVDAKIIEPKTIFFFFRGKDERTAWRQYASPKCFGKP